MSRTEVAEHLGNRAMALAASLALLLVLCSNAWAASPTETLQGVFAAVNRVLGDPEFQEKPRELMGAIHNVMGATFDFREAARLAMGRESERWAVYDVSVGGISLVASYRAQFSKVIKQSSYDGLVARLKNPRGN